MSAGPRAELTVGVVVIGRNEGERLRRCLESVAGVGRFVYVDSGSTDGSPELARGMGAEVVALDMSQPFTASRARNVGFRVLRRQAAPPDLVQFLDGDMEVLPGWIEAAVRLMQGDPQVVAVSGVRRERSPDRNVFHRIADVEWRIGPIGPTDAFGGDVMIRAEALERVGGYDPNVIAAEDNELAVRLRRAGGQIVRIDVPSTLHDVAMTAPAQWWRRAKRTGHAYAQVSALHGQPPERYFLRERNRVLLFGVGLPAAAVGLVLPTLGSSLLLLGVYPLQAARVARATHRQGFGWAASLAWGANCAFSKIPESLGLAKFYVDRLRGRAPAIIEHKG